MKRPAPRSTKPVDIPFSTSSKSKIRSKNHESGEDAKTLEQSKMKHVNAIKKYDPVVIKHERKVTIPESPKFTQRRGRRNDKQDDRDEYLIL